MEQLKPILNGLWRHHFWVLCGVVAPLMFGGWLTTTLRLRSETADEVTKIEANYEKLKIDTANHPNESSKKGMEVYIEEVRNSVFGAWKFQYEQQKKTLEWPEELDPSFREQVEKFRPIEVLAYERGAEEVLLESDREHYRDYIKKELPKLAAIIGAKWAPAAGMMNAGGVGGPFGGLGSGPGTATTTEDTADEEYIVTWDPANQSKLQSSRFDWSQTTDRMPTTLEILYAQEDLWVLKALMEIVAQTNHDATGSYNATIKEIQQIQMGSDASESSGSIGAAGAGGMADALGLAFLGSDDEENTQESFGMARRTDPAVDRYVDNLYQPVDVNKLRKAVANEKPGTQDANLIVAKRMPVRLNLVMDSRRVHRLITACGNASLMVEVRQVRVNVDTGLGGIGGGGGDNPMDMMGGLIDTPEEGNDESTGFEALGGLGPTSGDPTAGALAGMEIEEDPPEHEVPVEIYGIVYIYNPVNVALLGVPPETETADATPAASNETQQIAAADGAGAE